MTAEMNSEAFFSAFASNTRRHCRRTSSPMEVAYSYRLQPSSSFLALPTELRLQIYSYLLTPSIPSESPYITGLVGTDHHDYYGPPGRSGLSSPGEPAESDVENARRTLEIRTLDPTQNPTALLASSQTLRTRLSIRTSRFRARTMLSTYALARNPGLHTTILQVCRQCHAEAAPVLYGSYTFSFSTHVEAIEPFLADLTPYSRGFIKSIGMVKRGLPYEREYDRAEWEGACAYLANPSSGMLNLRELRLGVVAGCPGPLGWDSIHDFSKEDFIFHLGRCGKDGTRTPPELEYRDFRGVRYTIGVTTVEEDEWRGMEWVGQLMAVKGLREVDVRAIVEHCPPPMSERMAFWVAFSKSVQLGFTEYLKEGMQVYDRRRCVAMQ